MGKGGTALGMIGIILAAGAIGFGFFVWNGQNTVNSGLNSDLDDLTDTLSNLAEQLNNITNMFNNLTNDFNSLDKTILVGVWEDLSRNTDYASYNTNRNWLFEFGENRVNNTEYISVSNSNTNITINKSGWYKIHVSAILNDIEDNHAYSMRFYKNSAIISMSSYLIGDLQYIYMDGTVFIECNATDYIEINAYSVLDDFDIYPIVNYHHLTIEYVVV